MCLCVSHSIFPLLQLGFPNVSPVFQTNREPWSACILEDCSFAPQTRVPARFATSDWRVGHREILFGRRH